MKTSAFSCGIYDGLFYFHFASCRNKLQTQNKHHDTTATSICKRTWKLFNLHNTWLPSVNYMNGWPHESVVLSDCIACLTAVGVSERRWRYWVYICFSPVSLHGLSSPWVTWRLVQFIIQSHFLPPLGASLCLLDWVKIPPRSKKRKKHL